MRTNLQHWTEFYSKPKTPLYPSQFAVFVHSWLMGKSKKIIEIGCGNGRDSQFFHNNGHLVSATDQVINNNLKEYASANSGFSTAEGDVIECVSEILENNKNAVLYSRFFQHAIPAETEDRLLSILSSSLGEDSMLFFEFRLSGDQERPKVFGNDHYRRFQSSKQFVEKLEANGFDCLYTIEGEGFARYGDEDPIVGRFVAGRANKVKLKIV